MADGAPLTAEDDFDAFLERAKTLREVPVSLTHPSIPNAPVSSPVLSDRPSSLYSPSTYRLGDGFADAGLNAGFGGNPQNQQQQRDDDSSLFSASMPGLNANSRPKKPEPSLHLIASSTAEGDEDARSQKSGKSAGKKTKGANQPPLPSGKARSISGMSGMTAAQQGAVSGVPAHKIAFEKFHNEVSAMYTTSGSGQQADSRLPPPSSASAPSSAPSARSKTSG